jgi:hypothetical protein
MRPITIKRTIISAGVLSLLVATPAFAARPSAPTGPTGSIDLIEPVSTALVTTESDAPQPLPEVTYGTDAHFGTTLDGNVSNKADVYVTVLCWQGDTAVYHSSANLGDSFLMQDRGAQVLHWDEKEADCEASLIYRVDKGKSSSFETLDHVSFKVVPEAPSTIVSA